jgi:hypothetical protein
MTIEVTAIVAEEIRQLLRQHELDLKVHCLRVGVKGLGPNHHFMLAFGEPDARWSLIVPAVSLLPGVL